MAMRVKIFFAAVLLLFVHFVQAQRFGIKGGVNFANVAISTSGVSISPSSITGFQAGPVIECNLNNSLYLNSGVLYSLKGFKIKSGTDKMQETFNYLEIPVNVAYKFPTGGNMDFFIQAGPYLAYAASGKTKLNDVSVDLDFKEQGIKRFDYGLGFGAGLDLGALVASINYQLGLNNLNDDSTTEGSIKNKVFQVSLAYMFGKK
jgi:hypothetical protein